MSKQPTNHTSLGPIDDIVGKQFPVLGDGFVRLVDYMGDDRAIVQAARISYGIGTRQVHRDRGLIRYLMRHRHTTPFEMCEVKLHVRVPMDTWRQWIRHRTANVNEYSTRYSEAVDSMQSTPYNGWRKQSHVNRQGSAELVGEVEGRHLTEVEGALHERSKSVYMERLALGVSREQARKDLPLCTYTEAYWKIDLHNLLHFLELRSNVRAQQEIRAYAEVIGYEIVRVWCPLAWEAFVDYVLCSMRLSRIEQKIIVLIVAGDIEQAREEAISSGLLRCDKNEQKLANRQLSEFERKLRALGHQMPW